MSKIINIENIGVLNEMLKQSKPKHPLISVVDFSKANFSNGAKTQDNLKYTTGFYSILLKQLDEGSVKYGREYYDFQEGTLFFMSPNQVFSLESSGCVYGWGLYFHPDLIKGTSLTHTISDYSFFKYHVNEALHLSEDEKSELRNIVNGIEAELNRPIDKHSKSVIVSGIELLLNHCMRYYDRQFITRDIANKSVLASIEQFLSSYFKTDLPKEKGLPTVKQCAQEVNLSTNYLSDLLKKETGKSTQEHIHYYLIEEAKNRLLTSNNTSISEIAYGLGFEYPQYFSKIFKKIEGISSVEYRSLN